MIRISFKALLLTAIVLLEATLLSRAQMVASYSCETIAHLAELVSIEVIPTNTNAEFKSQNRDYPLVVGHVGAEITHIGLDLFGSSVKEDEYKVPLQFVERYLLELIVEPNSASRNMKMEADDVEIKGDIFDPPTILEGSTINLSIELSNRLYTVEWSNRSKKISISFPANYSLMVGKNKIELEDGFSLELSSFVDSKEDSYQWYFDPSNAKLKETEDGVFEYKRGSYMIDSAFSALYFSKDGAKYEYINSIDYPIETIYNLLCSPAVENSLNVAIHQQKYSFLTDKYYFSLTDIISYLMRSGCTPYVGVESFESNNVVVTLMMVNRDLCYNHILKFTFDTNDFSNMKGIVDADINVYIPTHNLANIYDDENQVKSKHKIKL